MEYILRVAVHEDAWRRQLGELLELCARTPIREVMLMEESHQLLTSPFPRKSTSAWLLSTPVWPKRLPRRACGTA